MAYVMVETAGRIKPRRDGRHPADKYFLTWTAFSAIYASLAHRQGIRTKLLHADDGSVVTRPNGGVRIPEVVPVSEQSQLALALADFDESLKDALIRHPGTAFFLQRTPFWQGKKIAQDAAGQRLNGVLHVTHTTSADYPVWSPIDATTFASYMEAPTPEGRDFLTGQIVDLLYTVRQNMMQISTAFDDANDIAVFTHALPLLEMIVGAFLG
jgi:hypothetical protein